MREYKGDAHLLLFFSTKDSFIFYYKVGIKNIYNMCFELEQISKNKARYKFVYHHSATILRNKVVIYKPVEFSIRFLDKLEQQLSNLPLDLKLELKETDGWKYFDINQDLDAIKLMCY